MDVVLGVAVADRVARLALVGSAARGGVIDQSEVDLADSPIEKLTETVVGTNRILADENHRLVATRLCWTDHPKADQLRRMLEDSGVQNVVVLSESDAATALWRTSGSEGSTMLLVGDSAATLMAPALQAGDEDSPPTMLAAAPLAGADGETAALDTMMARLGDQAGTMGDLYLVGSSAELTTSLANQLRDTSTMRVVTPEDPTFAMARGAALSAWPATMSQAALLTGDATAMSPAARLTGDATAMSPAAQLTAETMGFAPEEQLAGFATGFAPTAAVAGAPAEEPQLAYSLADDGDELLPVEMDEYDDDFVGDEEQTGPLRLSTRSLLISNAVVAFAIIGFASLAVAVAVSVRPTSASEPVIGHQNAAPGKFMPLLPTQQQAPVPPPPPDAPNIGYQGGIIPDTNGYIPPRLIQPAPAAPVEPVAPPGGTPGFVPNPNMPIPIPVIVPFPGWRPPPIWVPPIFPRPWNPPIFTTTVTTTPSIKPLVPTTTPPTPPTPSTPSTKPLVPTTAPTTAVTTPPTPLTTPPTASTPVTTSQAPVTTSQAPVTTTVPTTKAPTTTVAPPPTTKVQTTAAPPQTQTQTQAPQTQAPHTQTQAPQTQAPAPHTQAPVPQTQAPAPHTQAPVQPKPVVPQTPSHH